MPLIELVVVFCVSLPVFVALLLVSYWQFDRLLHIAISEARPEWEANDCPSGYFWKPEGSRPLSLRRRGFIWSHWFLHRPSWTTSSTQAARVYASFRLIGCLVFLTFLPVFLTACLVPVALFSKALCFAACR